MEQPPRQQVILVPHTHWDREWYLSQPQFSLILVRLIDRLLEILESEPDYLSFMLDGQTIALEDYLELKPEAAPAIEAHVRAGRILIGPWFVLPDEVLISGEAHIRNYLLGRRLCRRWGGGMQVGYLPDSFGHPSQMPQILKGLGLQELVFWRGLGPEIQGSEFFWEGFDGSRVLGLNMPLGYGVGACLPREREQFLRRVQKKVAGLAPLSVSGVLLLMNGVDHVAPERDLGERIEWANAQQDRFTLVGGTLPEYVRRVREGLAGKGLPAAHGELRSGYRAYLLGGTVSTRMYLKQLNARAERLLEAQLEPVLSACSLLGASEYPRSLMNALWRAALENLPHDSICGCSIDEVHEQMQGRFAALFQRGEALREETLAVLGSRIRVGEGEGLLVFNPHPHPVTDWIEMEVELLPRLARRVEHGEGRLVEQELPPRPLPERVQLLPPAGEPVEAQILRIERAESMRLSLDEQPSMFEVFRAGLRFPVRDLPALGYRAYRILASDAPPAGAPEGRGAAAAGSAPGAAPAASDDTVLENEWFRVGVEEGGTVFLRDRQSGLTHSGLLLLEDGGDAGDEYSYCPPEKDRLLHPDPASLSVERRDPFTLSVSGAMRLPAGLAASRRSRLRATVRCPFSMAVSLFPGLKRVEVRVSFENNAADHVLKLAFPTSIRSEEACAEGTFCVERRAWRDPRGREDAGWVEAPSNVHPHKGLVCLSDGVQGLSVFTRGLPEFEMRREAQGMALAITLLRCVGSISRKDLSCRMGNAGWPLPTPGAQCPGTHSFELAFLFHPGGWEGPEPILRAARQYRLPPFGGGLRPPLDPESALGPALPGELSLLGIDDPRVFLSAIKPAESGEGWVLRLVNPSPQAASTRLTFGAGLHFRRALLCDLREEAKGEEVELQLGAAGEEGQAGGASLTLAFRGGEIKTLKLLPAAGSGNQPPPARAAR
jgi:alpha-mannosidase